MKIKSISENRIVFDNDFTLEAYHRQDCCENVYADFENMQVKTNIGQNSLDVTTLDFDEDLFANIKLEEDIGFSLVSKNGIEIFVSCYDYQTGDYSSNLELQYYNSTKKSKEILDIANCVKSEYY